MRLEHLTRETSLVPCFISLLDAARFLRRAILACYGQDSRPVKLLLKSLSALAAIVWGRICHAGPDESWTRAPTPDGSKMVGESEQIGSHCLPNELRRRAVQRSADCRYRSPVKEWQVSWFVLGAITFKVTDTIFCKYCRCAH